MSFRFLVLCCIVQTIYGFNITEDIIFPPDVTSTRIIGGENAQDGIAPFQCSMQVYRRHHCGCSIISDQWILTASHCVVGQSPRNTQILVGTNDLGKGGTYYKVEKLIAHEDYNNPPFAYDIAVIRIRGKIEFNERVQPIEYSPDEVPDDADVQLTGWGRLRAGGEAPQLLQIIQLSAVATDRCRDIFGGNVHDSHICTLTRVGEGACNGDSGGPLVYQKKVIGVVNFGVPCGRGYPDAYGKVSYLYDWIKENTN